MRAIVFALACAVAFPAFAKDKPPAKVTCKLSFTGELKDARTAAKAHPIGVYPIEGKDVPKFLAVFNDTEPKTDEKAEQVIVIAMPSAAYVELFVGGCRTDAGKLGLPMFEHIMGAAFGDEVANGLAM